MSDASIFEAQVVDIEGWVNLNECMGLEYNFVRRLNNLNTNESRRIAGRSYSELSLQMAPTSSWSSLTLDRLNENLPRRIVRRVRAWVRELLKRCCSNECYIYTYGVCCFALGYLLGIGMTYFLIRSVLG